MARNNKNIKKIMNREDSIIILKKLYLLLDDLMGETLLGRKYTKSLKKGIRSLEKNSLLVKNHMFQVKVKNKKGVIIIDVKDLNGEIIESHVYDSKNIISDDIVGKS